MNFAISGSSRLAAPIVAHSPGGRSGRPVLHMPAARQGAIAEKQDGEAAEADREREQIPGRRTVRVNQAARDRRAEGGSQRCRSGQPRHSLGLLPGGDGHLSEAVGTDERCRDAQTGDADGDAHPHQIRHEGQRHHTQDRRGERGHQPGTVRGPPPPSPVPDAGDRTAQAVQAEQSPANGALPCSCPNPTVARSTAANTAPRHTCIPISTRSPGLRNALLRPRGAPVAGGSVCRRAVSPATPTTLSTAVTRTPATGWKSVTSATTSTGPAMKMISSPIPSSENAASSREEPGSRRLHRVRTIEPRAGIVPRLRQPGRNSVHTGACPTAQTAKAAVDAAKITASGRSTRACPNRSASRAAYGVTAANASAPRADTAPATP